VDWIKLRIAEAIGGKQPISRKLLIGVGATLAAVIFLINGVSSGSTEKIAVQPELPADQLVVKAATIYVHIVGEVESPGIYEVDSGARIVDVVFAAGGFSDKADQSSVNLAREVTDGEQVVVFKVGAASAQFGNAFGGSGVGSGVGSGFGSAGSQISLNHGSQSELEQLPGVGPALAGRMIDWRNANGGFKKKEDLLNISGIGDKLFAGIKDEVTL
jgi:competence protein ComEA